MASHKPLIAEEARRLKTFLAAMADGVIDKDELGRPGKAAGPNDAGSRAAAGA